jgi:hypothetical protein
MKTRYRVEQVGGFLQGHKRQLLVLQIWKEGPDRDGNGYPKDSAPGWYDAQPEDLLVSKTEAEFKI